MKKIPIVKDPPANRATLKDTLVQSAVALRRWLGHATEPHILFPTIAVVVLALIWGTTLNLIKVQHAAAEHNTAVLSHELAETYEAQVVRAMREIDQTLKIVKYAYESAETHSNLDDLKNIKRDRHS